MNQLGAIVVSLGLDAADFIDGMTKADQRAQRFGANLSNQIAIGVAKAEVALRALGVAAQFAIRAFPELVDQAGKFQDLSEKTGASAEGLASLAVSAKIGGTSMEEVANASVKLTKNLTGVDDESKSAGAALKALGINIKDFKQLAPDQQIETLAKSLAGFEEGSGKAAVAVALLGKSGADLLPFLKELGSGVGRVNILTAEQIRLADEYADRSAKSNAQLNLYGQQIATQLVPATTAFKDALSDMAKEILGVGNASNNLAGNKGVAQWGLDALDTFATVAEGIETVTRLFNVAGIKIGGTFAAIDQRNRGNEAGAAEIRRSMDAEVDAILGAARFSDKLRAQIAEQRKALAGNGITAGDFARSDRNPKPRIDYSGAKEDGGALLKKQLDGELKQLREFLAAQQSAFDYAQSYTKGYYDSGNISLSEFNEEQRRLRAESVRIVVEELDAEIAALKKHKAQVKGAEQVKTQTEIAEATAKRALVMQKGSQDASLAMQQEEAAVKSLQRQYESFLADMRELSGDPLGAARIRTRQQADDIEKLLRQKGFSEADAKRTADDYAERRNNVSALGQAQKDFNDVLELTRLREEEIGLAARLSGESELDTLRKVGQARTESLSQLQQAAEQARQLAAQLGNPEAELAARRLLLEYRKAASESNPILKRVQDTGKEIGSTIANGVEDWITGAKSLRDVLRGIEQDILRIMSRRLVTEPLGNWLSNLIGGNGTSSGGGGWLGSLLGGAFGMGGGSGVNLGTVTGADLGVAFATGGVAEPRSLHQVNERGPELLDVNGRQFLMMGNQRGRVTPMAAGGGGMTVVVNQSFAPGASRETFAQAATALTRSLRVHSARNG